jgi:hypothetical protein
MLTSSFRKIAPAYSPSVYECFPFTLPYNAHLGQVALVQFADYTTKWIRAGSPTSTKPLAPATPKEWPQRGYDPHGRPRVHVFENLGIRGEYAHGTTFPSRLISRSRFLEN